MARMFGKEYLLEVFRKLGAGLDKKVEAFVLGGGAMCFRNQKTGTKDLDIVFRNDLYAKFFTECARKEGYAAPQRLGDTYQLMKAYSILENSGGFRFDIFSKKVCGCLALGRSMVARAERFGNFGKLSVHLVSNEDVILFKGITERAKDADDIAAVMRSSRINWNVVLEECKRQSSAESWHGLLYNKLAEIEDKHGLRAPIMVELLKMDRQVLIRNAFEMRLKKGMGRKDAIADLMKTGFSKKELEGL